MATSTERQALWFLAIVALSGAIVRLARARSGDPPQPVSADWQINRVDSAKAAPRAKKQPRVRTAQTRDSTDSTPGLIAEPVDLNRASAAEIEALPGIGPALAQRIVAFRDSVGGIRSLDSLCRVRGVGPALAERLRPLVVFSGTVPTVSDGCGDASKSAVTRGTRARRKPR